MSTTPLGPFSWDRMIEAVEKAHARHRRVVVALEEEGVDYAIVGGNALAAWVARVDESAIRNTPDVDVIINRGDLERAKSALSQEGFVYHNLNGEHKFFDGPHGKLRNAVHLLMAGEFVRSSDASPAARLSETEVAHVGWCDCFRVVTLEALVRMKLTSYRRKDQVHLLDLIDVGLVDATWPAKFPPELAARLQALLDDPDG